MSSAHEIVFKDVSVPAPNKSALKTKVSSSKKRNKGWQWLDLIWKKIMTQWDELLAPADDKVVSLWNCFHLRRSVAAWDEEVYGGISLPMPNIKSLRLECFWRFFFKQEPRDFINQRLIQHKLINRCEPAWQPLPRKGRWHKRSVLLLSGAPLSPPPVARIRWM